MTVNCCHCCPLQCLLSLKLSSSSNRDSWKRNQKQWDIFLLFRPSREGCFLAQRTNSTGGGLRLRRLLRGIETTINNGLHTHTHTPRPLSLTHILCLSQRLSLSLSLSFSFSRALIHNMRTHFFSLFVVRTHSPCSFSHPQKLLLYHTFRLCLSTHIIHHTHTHTLA